MWSHEHTPPLLTELAVNAAAFAAEQVKHMEEVAPSESGHAGGRHRSSTSGRAPPGLRRHHYLAELVPSLMRHSSARFGAAIQEARELLARHRRERSRLCADLNLVEASPPSPRVEKPPRPQVTIDPGLPVAEVTPRVVDGAIVIDDGRTTPLMESSQGVQRPGSIGRLARGISQRINRASFGKAFGKKSRDPAVPEGQEAGADEPSMPAPTPPWRDFKQWATRSSTREKKMAEPKPVAPDIRV